MEPIQALLAPLAQSVIIQRQAIANKDQQIRQAQVLKKNSGATGDRFEHEVESTDAVSPIHEERPEDHDRSRKPKQQTPEKPPESDEVPRLDLTA